MIPKIIYYCWFGGKPLPKETKRYIRSWKKCCREYTIVELNEKNFNIQDAPLYVRQAYKLNKWAFVSDYVRLWALVNNGGIYIDTDVELLKPLDDLLDNRAFAFFETDHSISTGLLGCEKNFPLFGEWMQRYHERTFLKENGELDLTTNVQGITDICIERGMNPNNTFQIVDGIQIYPEIYFFSRLPGRIDINNQTYGIHYFSCSWKTDEEQTDQKNKMAYLRHRFEKERKKQKLKNLIKIKTNITHLW